MNKIKILLDGDGCVFDLLTAVTKINDKFRPDKVLDYDMKILGYGIPRNEFFHIVNNPDVLNKQPLYPNAEKGVKELIELGDVVGWSGVSEINKKKRKEQFAEIGIYKTDLEKTVHSDADVVIDDDTRQLLRFGKKTLKFLVKRSYNTNQTITPDIIVIDDILQISDYIKKIKGVKQ